MRRAVTSAPRNIRRTSISSGPLYDGKGETVPDPGIKGSAAGNRPSEPAKPPVDGAAAAE